MSLKTFRKYLLADLFLSTLLFVCLNGKMFPRVLGEEMMSAYTSMRALDKFGNSVQLRHAREAAIRHGRLIVAAKLRDVAVPAEIIVVSFGSRKLVHSLALPFASAADDKSGTVAMCCTGVKSDAEWLTRHIQNLAARVWCRYDQTSMATTALAYSIARLLGSYEGNDIDEEWQSTIQGIHMKRSSNNQGLDSSLSRPLGVQALVLSTRKGDKDTDLLLVEPTGRVFTAERTKYMSFVAIGKQSEEVGERLLRATMENSAELEKCLVNEILEALSPSKNEITELIVETLRSNPLIERKTLVCKNGKVLSSSPLST